jgi:hypothetical protein
VLAFRVIKIEYRRTLHQDAIPAPCPPVDTMNPYGIPLPCEFQRIHPEKRGVVAVATEGSFPTTKNPSISRFPGTTRSSKSSFLSTFLTGSGSQTEFPVTHSKQRNEKILTGARTRIRIFETLQISAQNLAELNPAKPRTIRELQSISTRHSPICRMRRISLKTNDRDVSTRSQNRDTKSTVMYGRSYFLLRDVYS